MRYRAPKITDEGLDSYLSRTAAKHKGMQYADLERMIKAEISLSSMSKLFGVDHRTIKNYIRIYHEEKGKSQR